MVSKLCPFFLRRFHSTERNVRVRFAPSPTGYMHLGGLRTALYNYLFARANKGKFILRIEDTDRSRCVDDAIEQIQNDLEWVNLIPDEGPKYGGPNGSYIQSERIELYKEQVDRLIANGAAYYCFCTERRLDLLRRDAIRSRQLPRYDNHCRNLSSVDIKRKLSEGIEKCVRFKLIPSEPFNDLIYGSINHDVMAIEGDPIILKTDGWPTYHLANVIDDNKMKITHVIRGVEWIQSTNKHLMIYKALDYEPPFFAHLPLIMNKDGTKLSKRQGDLAIHSLRSRGILPNALINFVIQAGSGFREKPNLDSSIEELISKFDIKYISTNSSKLPLDRLEEFNKLELLKKVNDKNEMRKLVSEVKQLVLQSFSVGSEEINFELDDNHIETVLNWSLPRINRLKDLVNDDLRFLWIRPNINKTDIINRDFLVVLKKELDHLDFDQEKLKIFFKCFAKSQNIQFKDLMTTMRTVISGQKQGPGVAEMLMLLGKEAAIKRLERVEK